MTDIPVLPRHPREDYIDAPKAIAKRSSAEARGWAAGWPDACPAPSQRAQVSIPRPIDGRVFQVTVDARLAALVTDFLTMIQDVGNPLIGALEANTAGQKQGGVGSYVCRAIKGSHPPQPSNHSSATALDLWTRSNPMHYSLDRTPVPFVSTIHPSTVLIAAAGDIYWGGWYWDSRHDYVDAMHFEYMKRPEDVAASQAAMKAAYQRIKDALEPKPIPPEDPTVDEVKELQATLNALGTSPQLVVDGVYGPRTRAAVAGLPALVQGQVDAAEQAAKAETKDQAVEAVSNI